MVKSPMLLLPSTKDADLVFCCRSGYKAGSARSPGTQELGGLVPHPLGAAGLGRGRRRVSSWAGTEFRGGWIRC